MLAFMDTAQRGGKVLVTGGLGYIGSHSCVVAAQAGYELVIVDNLCNAKPAVLKRIRELAPGARIEFQELDIRDRSSLEAVLETGKVDAVIHFAGLKAVGESVQNPLLYYENNVGGTVSLLQAMKATKVRRLVFSSSATVYGDPEALPITESHRLQPTNPYGMTKLIIEYLLADYGKAEADFRYAALRYFNPAGAHPSGRLGEDPRGIPGNLFPYIAQVAVRRLPCLQVFGNDYPTLDGTAVRDYIHVMDLARGHLAALENLTRDAQSTTMNLGTGRGYSVLQAVTAFEQVSGQSVPLEFVPRRPGDVAAYFADASLANDRFGFKPEFGIEAICRDLWAWQSRNPFGYQ